MSAPNHLSPEERKRIRDRQSQRRHREKRDVHTRQLQELVSFCQRNHDAAHIQCLSQTVANLEAENRVLRKEREKLLGFVHQMEKSFSYLFPHLRGKYSHSHEVSPENGIHEPLVASSFGVPKRTDAVVLPGVDATSLRGGSQPAPGPDQLQLLVPDPTIASPQGSVAQIAGNEMHGVGTMTASPPLQHLMDGNVLQPSFNFPNSLLSTSLAADHGGSKTKSHTQLVGGDLEVQLEVAEEPSVSKNEASATLASQEPQPTTGSFEVGTHESPLNASNAELATRELQNTADWLRLPAISLAFDERRGHSGWLKFPHAVAMSPDVPAPEDILFGSRRNFLANEIHKSMRKIHLAEPERLAIGWLGYIVNKWRVGPTKESFERLPSFLRPTLEQVNTPHPTSFDVVPWPGLRDALIKQPINDQMHNIMDLISCCIKIRWPWGKEILDVKEDNSRHIKDEFYKTLMSLEGWGMTREFISAYPYLFENLEVEKIEISMC